MRTKFIHVNIFGRRFARFMHVNMIFGRRFADLQYLRSRTIEHLTSYPLGVTNPKAPYARSIDEHTNTPSGFIF